MKNKTDIISTQEFKNMAIQKKRNKYGNHQTLKDGYLFDSKLEAEYYEQLKLRRLGGDIKDFALQPRYPLQKAFKKGDKKIRKIDYVADFEIEHNDGSIEVIDVKGKKTDVFRIKEKLFHYFYPYELTLITHKDI